MKQPMNSPIDFQNKEKKKLLFLKRACHKMDKTLMLIDQSKARKS